MKKLWLMIGLAGCFGAIDSLAVPTMPSAVRIEVWSSQRWDDPFYSDDPLDIFFRVDEVAYLTIYQVNPWGGVDIIYPLPHHRWVAVLPRRIYSLNDLASDLNLYYEGAEGSAHLGIIATRDPIDIVPWLEGGFRNCGFAFGRPVSPRVSIEINVALERIHADLRFRLGSRCEPAFFSRVIHLRPRVVRPPVVIYHSPRPSVDIWGRWGRDRSSQDRQRTYDRRESGTRYRDSAPRESEQRTTQKPTRETSSKKSEGSKDRRVRKSN
jgi:hypothetical protein